MKSDHNSIPASLTQAIQFPGQICRKSKFTLQKCALLISLVLLGSQSVHGQGGWYCLWCYTPGRADHAWSCFNTGDDADDECPTNGVPSGDLACNSCVGGSTGGGLSLGSVGLPVWRVTEPMLNVWLRDTPVEYQPSRGPMIRFRLLYKNELDEDQASEMRNTNIFGVGNRWFTPWRCYLRTQDGTNFQFYEGRGGRISVTNGGSPTYRDQVTCSVDGNGVPSIHYPSGARDVFGSKFKASEFDYDRHFLTQRTSPEGHTTTFIYGTNNGRLCLTNITDVDGRSSSLDYTNVNGFALVSRVTDPFQRQVVMVYDQGAFPSLVGVTDPASLVSTFQYDNGYNLTNLTTPYSTTAFLGKRISDSSAGSMWVAERGIHQGLRNHLFLYVDEGDTSVITNSYAAWRPSTTNANFSFPNTFDAGNSHWRNTFYWNAVQWELLPSSFVQNLTNGTLDMSDLYSTNFLQGRQRHWLLHTNYTGDPSLQNYVSTALSLERAASQDGVTQGQITWYDYDGKYEGNPEYEGIWNLVRYIAWTLPNGESRFIHYQRNSLGHPTNVIETWNDSNGALRARTNSMTYAANKIDLLTVTNAGVQVSRNVYNSDHQVLNSYNALDEITTYTYDGNRRLSTRTTPTSLTTSNYYGGDNYLAQVVDIGFRTNSFTWTNGLIHTHIDERGLLVSNTWDNLNRLTRAAYPNGTIINIYSNLDLIMSVDRMGYSNRYYYNDFRQVVHAVDHLNRTNSNSYCDCGLLNSTTDAMNQTTTFGYDLQGNRSTLMHPINIISPTGTTRWGKWSSAGIDGGPTDSLTITRAC